MTIQMTIVLLFVVLTDVDFYGATNLIPFSVDLNVNGTAFLTMVFMFMHSFQPLKF